MSTASPPVCASCILACAEAWSMPACDRCGSTCPPYGAQDDGCAVCRGKRPRFKGVVRVGPYADAWANFIRRLKFGGRGELLELAADELSKRLLRSDWLERIDVVSPVPTCWRHNLRKRLYVSDELASAVAARTRIPFARLLKRKGGPHQVGRTLEERTRNVRGRFRLATGVRLDKPVVCLVDDVMTSGSTAQECARVLRAGGAKMVVVAVLARVHNFQRDHRHV